MPDKTTQKPFSVDLQFKTLSKHVFFNIIMSDMSQSDKIVENAMSPLDDYGYQKGKKVHNGLILRNTISHVNTSNMLGKHIVL